MYLHSGKIYIILLIILVIYGHGLLDKLSNFWACFLSVYTSDSEEDVVSICMVESDSIFLQNVGITNSHKATWHSNPKTTIWTTTAMNLPP
jgi:hypothetical protein